MKLELEKSKTVELTYKDIYWLTDLINSRQADLQLKAKKPSSQAALEMFEDWQIYLKELLHKLHS